MARQTARTSAALLVYREAVTGSLELLLGHMGGPFWARKDDGAWSIPKGEYEDGEEPLAAARREFAEETGLAVPEGEYLELGVFKQGSGKLVTTYAVRADPDLGCFTPGTFEMVWPPRSGRMQEFPELDRIAWLDVEAANRALVKGQVPIVAAVLNAVAAGRGG